MHNPQAVYGAQGRIGIVVPANNSVIEPELWSALPPDVAMYATRILAKGDLTAAAVHRMEADVDRAMEALTVTGVDVIAYCDMVTTFIMDPTWNERAVERFGASTGKPVISAWTALRDALSVLGARRIALGTPYPRDIHALAPAFFLQHGITIVSDATLDIVAMSEVPTVDEKRLTAFLEGLDTRDCDAIVLLATDLPTFRSITRLEQKFQRSVLTSNQTLLWRALSILNQKPLLPLGQLFER